MTLKKNIKTLSVVYAHYETHGPGIYHNELLAQYSNRLDIFFLNAMETTWQFPDNVTLLPYNKKQISLDSIYKKNPLSRWLFFIKFSLKLLTLVRKNKYQLIILFNSPAFLSYSLIRQFLPKNIKIWYHNYDPIDIEKTKKYSQAWFSYRAMFRHFSKIDLFTHTEEKRNIFFPIHLLRSSYYILPNYPLLKLHGGKKRKLENNIVSLVFSGVISPGNGLEELIKLSGKSIMGYNLNLILKGFILSDYKIQLENIVKTCMVEKNVIFIPAGPWREVPEVLRSCNIGIHIFHKADLVSKTMGKGGSGKVFQYIAEGLPVLMSPGFYENFKEYKWAFSTELDEESLIKNISDIILNYDSLSQNAADTFNEELNCDTYFDKIFKTLNLK